jgi:hypothetical protein
MRRSDPRSGRSRAENERTDLHKHWRVRDSFAQRQAAALLCSCGRLFLYKGSDTLGVERKYGSSDSYTQYRSWDIYWHPETGEASEGAVPLAIANREQREQVAKQDPPQKQYKRMPQRIAVSGNLQATNLIAKIEPGYPPAAKASGIQGDVKFEAVIGKDGRVVSLKPLSGDALLVEAARAAVMKWVYRPTSLAGEPVEVVTQIAVAFRP